MVEPHSVKAAAIHAVRRQHIPNPLPLRPFRTFLRILKPSAVRFADHRHRWSRNADTEGQEGGERSRVEAATVCVVQCPEAAACGGGSAARDGAAEAGLDLAAPGGSAGGEPAARGVQRLEGLTGLEAEHQPTDVSPTKFCYSTAIGPPLYGVPGLTRGSADAQKAAYPVI